MPALRRLAASAERWQTRAMAATAAWRLDPTSPEPFAEITNEVARAEPGSYEIVRLLGELGPAARPAIPTLRRLRYGRGVMMNDYAIEALQSIAPEYLSDPWRP